MCCPSAPEIAKSVKFAISTRLLALKILIFRLRTLHVVFVTNALVLPQTICYMQRADRFRLYHVRSWRNW